MTLTYELELGAQLLVVPEEGHGLMFRSRVQQYHSHAVNGRCIIFFCPGLNPGVMHRALLTEQDTQLSQRDRATPYVN